MFRFASVCVRCTLASASSRVAFALSSSASLWRRVAFSRAGSSSARTCPAATWSLKSACSFWTVPETCVPTWTSVTGLSVPFAVIVWTMSPRSTACVR